ncbi:MAG: hypothetical protein MUO59_03685 [Actinobacteria bacterium]|nr:hypothetical protein [Actinomycetota bacterium]
MKDNLSSSKVLYSCKVPFGLIGRKGQYLKPLPPGRLLLKGITVIFLFFLIIAALVMCGCTAIDAAGEYLYGKFTGEEERDESVETAGIFFDLIMEEDYRQAYKYISSSDRDKGSEQEFVDEFSDVTKIVGVEINWVEIKGNTALIGVDLVDSYDGEEKMYKDIEVSLVKEEDGSWKVVFWK